MQEAYDIISAATLLGIELPAPQGTFVYEATTRSRDIATKSEVTLTQYVGLYTSFESAMLAIAGLALQRLDTELAINMRPWIISYKKQLMTSKENVISMPFANVNPVSIDIYDIQRGAITPQQNASLKAEWIVGKTLETIILSYFSNYSITRREISKDPEEYISEIYKAERGEY
jgi:hypothetical protein